MYILYWMYWMLWRKKVSMLSMIWRLEYSLSSFWKFIFTVSPTVAVQCNCHQRDTFQVNEEDCADCEVLLSHKIKTDWMPLAYPFLVSWGLLADKLPEGLWMKFICILYCQSRNGRHRANDPRFCLDNTIQTFDSTKELILISSS